MFNKIFDFIERILDIIKGTGGRLFSSLSNNSYSDYLYNYISEKLELIKCMDYEDIEPGVDSDDWV